MANKSYNVTEAIRTIKAVNYALERLEIKGRDNMDILLGSMKALEQAVNVIDKAFSELDQPISRSEDVSDEETMANE